jgi:hypothetical protein
VKIIDKDILCWPGWRVLEKVPLLVMTVVGLIDASDGNMVTVDELVYWSSGKIDPEKARELTGKESVRVYPFKFIVCAHGSIHSAHINFQI